MEIHWYLGLLCLRYNWDEIQQSQTLITITILNFKNNVKHENDFQIIFWKSQSKSSGILKSYCCCSLWPKQSCLTFSESASFLLHARGNMMWQSSLSLREVSHYLGITHHCIYSSTSVTTLNFLLMSFKIC